MMLILLKFKSYYRHIKPGSFELHGVSEDFILDEINNLNVAKIWMAYQSVS